MTAKEILNLEGNLESRVAESKNIIYLIRDSDSSPWYKAYCWSAYLMEFYPNNLEDAKKLKPIKRQIKSEDSAILVHVGLQLPSLSKYLPDVKADTSTPNLIRLIVDPTLYNDNIISLNNYNKWIETIPLKEDDNKSKNNKNSSKPNPNSPFTKLTTFTSIVKDIFRFDTYNKSQEDLLEFVRYLKEECIKLI